MNAFIKLNSWKLKFAFKWTSAVFTGIVVLVLVIAYFNGQVPEIDVLFGLLIGASLVFPIFIVTIATLRGVWDLNKRIKAFETSPFSELKQNGFSVGLKNENSKWSFSEPILNGVINEYPILAEVDTQTALDVVRFKALTVVKPLDKEEMRRLIKKFNLEDIQFDKEGITKMIHIKDKRYSSSKALVIELEQFTDMLKKENLKSIKMAKHNNN